MGKFNLWIYWEAYKMRNPEMRQVLEWQEQDYNLFCSNSQNGSEEEGKNKDGCVQKQTYWENLYGSRVA